MTTSRSTVSFHAVCIASVLALASACSADVTQPVDADMPAPVPLAPIFNLVTSDDGEPTYIRWFRSNACPGCEYEIRVRFHGYTNAYAAPVLRGGSGGEELPGGGTAPIGSGGTAFLFPARLRLGAPNEYITVDLCKRNYDPTETIYLGCDMVDTGWLINPSDNRVRKYFLYGGYEIELAWQEVYYAVDHVDIDPPSAYVYSGMSTHLNAIAYDALNRKIPGWPVSWSSSNTKVATVSFQGYVEGDRPGTARITGKVSTKSDYSSVTVVNALAASIEGQFDVQPHLYCYWIGSIGNSNATEPLSYEWRVNEVVRGTDSMFSWTVGGVESSFQLALNVRDAEGREGWAFRTVTVSEEGASSCEPQ